ncbi:MAG: ABC transporter ATP-binding protein [Nitriliruptor sp.]|uniref:ABC transporter ATP-binding protein n=1 Tax=Nitriliruptor sp. TaxID=2448056 RepID=UPI00349FED26
MTDDTHDEGEALELDHVEWQQDDDGTEWFVHEGWRYELDDDGYAYAVSEVSETDEASPPSATDGDDASAGEGSVQVLDATTAIPPVRRPASAEIREPAPATAPAPDDGSSPLLRLSGVRSGYGPLPVLHGVDLDVHEGKTAVLFGLNGAGKTTTAMNVCGALPTWEGSIEFDGQDVTKWNTKRCVDAGIVMVPEGRRVFPELSVERNLQVGSWSQRKDGDWVASQREQVLDYFPRLRERLVQLAGTLSGGEQQMLAIARGLMAKPKLLIVDEASMGLAPVIVKDVFEIVRAINADGVTVLLIEQNVGALDVADLGVVMSQGRIVKTLSGAELTDRSVVSKLLMG